MKSSVAKPRVVRFALIAALLCVAFFAYIEYSKRNAKRVKVLVSTPQLQSVDIGSYSDAVEARDPAIQELSRQIMAHPKTAVYKIYYEENNSYNFDSRFIYDRLKRTFVYRHVQKSQDSPPVAPSSRWIWTSQFPFIIKQTYPLADADYAYDFDLADISHVTDQAIHSAAKHKLSWKKLFDATKPHKS